MTKRIRVETEPSRLCELAKAADSWEATKQFVQEAGLGLFLEHPYDTGDVAAIGSAAQASDEEIVDEPRVISRIAANVDDYLGYFFSRAFNPPDRPAGTERDLPFSCQLFGQKRLESSGGTSTAEQYAWVCDSFVKCKRLKDIAELAGDDACRGLHEDRKIDALEKSVLKLLGKAIREPECRATCDWELTQLFLRDENTFLSGVHKKVKEKPLSKSEAERLAGYLGYGIVNAVSRLLPGVEPWSFRVEFYIDRHDSVVCPEDRARSPMPGAMRAQSLYSGPRHAGLARLLAAPAAFEVCTELAEYARDPKRDKFIRKCRNPRCRRLFYTNDARAKCCPSKSPGHVSPCKNQWDNFSRHLEDEFPSDDDAADLHWDEDDVISAYLSPGGE